MGISKRNLMYNSAGAKRKFAEMNTSSSIASYSCTVTQASIPDGMADKIKGIAQRFEEISNARRDLHLREEDGTRLVIDSQFRPPTSSHVDERAIFGREEEKEQIISLLNLSGGPNFMVLPIVGMGGFGKTTLAQLVYNDSIICRIFNKRCWVSVSVDFDLVRLTKAIVDSMSDKPFESSELSILQDVLFERIRGLGLFLVLDDVWNEQRDMWDSFQVAFLSAKFVRILMTTRNISVAKIMQTTTHFTLGSLPDENCWSLFKHLAFGNREASENANLHKIGRGIVDKCKGSPLAIKALGGTLRYEMEEEKWMEILESDISEIDETGKIMPALRISYQKLPRHLKPCFLYLSTFPKDKPFQKGMMVRLWMAQGYINGNTRNSKTLEEIGNEYFDELQGRSLLEMAHAKLFSSESFTQFFLLHHFMHDLARSISEEACRSALENHQQCYGPPKICHLYLNKKDEFLGSLLPPGNSWSIRTFIKECPSSRNFDFTIFSEIACARAIQLRYSLLPNTLGMLKHLRYLSVEDRQMEALPETLCLLYNLQTLYVDSTSLRELPECIKNLINLRYFELKSHKIQQLPKSIFLLRNLHTLSLRYCTKLSVFPRGIEQLTRLRILDLSVYLINMPYGIGKLTNLKPLRGNFSVTGHAITGGLGELKDMNNLRGLLCISGLGKINDVEYSRKANLASKPNLHKLILNFQEESSMLNYGVRELHLLVCSRKNAKNENDEKIQHDVLQSLQPCGNLTELTILNYGGRVLPSWLLYPLLPKLTTLTLNFWSEPNFLPPFGQLPYLRFLEISGSFGVGFVGDKVSTYSLLVEYGSSKQPKEPSYPSLKVLSLKYLFNLVEWQAYDGDFPCLEKLVIENCPKLWKIATIPQKVRDVTFSYCSKLEFLTCPSEIRKLRIHNCGFHEIMFGSISEEISISNCLELKLIKWGHGGLNSISEVSFQYCPKLELVTIPVGTLKLKIYECGFREIMFQSVSENLTISNCVELISVNWRDMNLNYVREVCFKYCPKLKVVTIPVGTLKLEIHKCGFRDIMFRSVSENLGTPANLD
ncbi:putative disease resistance protein RGA3 [Carex rostrata]